MAGYIGATPVPQATQHRKSFTATAGQTSFATGGYTPKFIDVYLNGVKLAAADFTATNGSDVVLASGAAVGDILETISFTAFEIASQTFSGTTTVDDLSVTGAFTSNGIDDNANATAITIDSSENVGIGTSSPTVLLDLESASPIIRLTDSDASGTPECQISGAGGDLIFDADRDNEKASSVMSFKVDGSEAMRLDGSGHLLHTPASQGSAFVPNTSSTWNALEIFQDRGVTNSASGIAFRSQSGTAPAGIVSVAGNTTGGIEDLAFMTASGNQTFERMRIAGGNLLVGKTTVGVSSVGAELRGGVSDYAATAVSSSHAAALFGRNTDDGVIIKLRKDNSDVGSIACRSSGGNLQIHTNQSGIDFGGDGFLPMRGSSITDNSVDIGSASYRFDDIYATNGTIQTSDANEKQQIASLTDTEMTAAKAISALYKTFKWNDSVADKGDAARTHTGVIAQEVEQAMTDAGLDAGDYAFFISATWWETQTEVPAVEADEENGVEAADAYTRTDTYDTVEEAPEGATERNRKGIRYPELLAFVGAATEQRLASIETRLTALEAE